MRVLYRVPSAFLTLILLSAPCLLAQRLSESTGVNLFKNNCTKCHGIAPVEHAPTEATIKQMPPERIYAAITTGSMKENAGALADADKRLLPSTWAAGNWTKRMPRHEEHAQCLQHSSAREI